MTTAVVGAFKEAGINQTAGDVANIILGIQTTPAMNGKAIYSEGGQGWEFEDGYYHNMPRWLGEEPTRMLRTNLALVAGVSPLDTKVLGAVLMIVCGVGCLAQVVQHMFKSTVCLCQRKRMAQKLHIVGPWLVL